MESGEGSDISEFSQQDHEILNDRFKREKVKYSHGDVLVRDVEPENKREDEVVLLSTLGFGTGNIALQRTVTELYYMGEHVVELDFLGGGKGVTGEDGSSSEYNRQGMLMAEFMDDYFRKNPHIKQMDLMIQSAGLNRLSAIVDLRPDLLPRIRSVILSSPVGLDEKEGIIDLLKRQKAEGDRYKKLPKGEFDQENADNLKEAFKSQYLRHPVKAIKEGLGARKANKYPMLQKLRDAGIKVGIMQGDDDLLADRNKLLNRIGEGYKKPFKQGINQFTEETINLYEPQEKPPPPVDALRLMGGGHGIQVDDPKKAAKTIVGLRDYIISPHDSPIEVE